MGKKKKKETKTTCSWKPMKTKHVSWLQYKMDKNNLKLTQGREGSMVLVRLLFKGLGWEVKSFVFSPGEEFRMLMNCQPFSPFFFFFFKENKHCQPQVSGEHWMGDYNNEKETRRLLYNNFNCNVNFFPLYYLDNLD